MIAPGTAAAEYSVSAHSDVVPLIDTEDRRWAEALLTGEKRILEMVAKDDALPQILDSVCRLVEEQASGVLASILLLDGDRLRHGGAPSLPEAYTDAIDGATIGPSAGSCGTAAFRREQVIVEDIATDPLWAAYRDLALPHGLRACWSTPVFISRGEVIATFAMYYREPRRPSHREQHIIEQATHLAGVAIERRLTQERLRRSESYLAESQRLTHTGSWAYDCASGEFTYWSEENFRIWGLDPRYGLPNRDIVLQRIHPDDRERAYESGLRAAELGSDYSLEFRIVRPDSSVRNIYGFGHHRFDKSGAVIALSGTHVDVTDRKRAEDERERLRQLEADLARVNRVTTIGELSASLAHEVNQPIAAVITDASTCLRWLTRDQPDLQEARDAARRAIRGASRAAGIISRMRALLQKSSPDHESLNVNGLIAEIIALVGSEARRYDVAISSHLAADIPVIVGDRIQLQQVLLNLMVNSIEATKEVDGRREITVVSTRDAGDDLLVSVSDTGVGLPPNASEIFNAFVTTKPEGTGMGLAISRSIVESHGGRLWAAAHDGRGVTFSFKLPGATTPP